MSRRKQANPKSIRRRSESELEELGRQYDLPQAHLQLKDSDSPTDGVHVFTKGSLPQGTCFGPYQGGQVTSDDSMRPEYVLKFTDPEKIVIGLGSQKGAWLSLLETSNHDDSNAIIYVCGESSIWCEISRNIDDDQKLVTSYGGCIKLATEADSESASAQLETSPVYSRSSSPVSNEEMNSTEKYSHPALNTDDDRYSPKLKDTDSDVESQSATKCHHRQERSELSPTGDRISRFPQFKDSGPEFHLKEECTQAFSTRRSSITEFPSRKKSTPEFENRRFSYSEVSVKEESACHSQTDSVPEFSARRDSIKDSYCRTDNIDMMKKSSHSNPSSWGQESNPPENELGVPTSPTGLHYNRVNPRVEEMESASKSQGPMYPLIYICVHCGVKFSSPSTLEAHMMFYCHKRPQEGTTSTTTQSSKQMSPAKPTSPQIHSSPQKPGSVPAPVHPESSNQGHKEGSPEQMDIIKIEPKTPSPPMTPVNQDRSITMATQRSPKKRDYSHIAEGKESTEMSPQKIPRVETILRCPNCPFATDSQAVFEAHMLEHSPGMSGFNGNFLCEDVTYCKECNIQFSSKKTFNGHKEFYCEKRRRKPSQSSRSPASHESPKMLSPPATQPIRISPLGPGSSIRPNHNLPTIPVPMVPAPGLVVTNGLIQQSPTVVLAAPIITQQPLTNGGPLNVPTVIMQPVISLPDPAHAHHVTSTGRTSQNRNNTEEKPLDLTVKRESRENKPDTQASLKIREKTPSPVRSSPEKRESVHVWKDRSPVHAGPPALVRCPSSPLQGPPVTKVSGSHEKPAVPTMSTECHNCKIKFSSVEIYLIHKKHYCRGSSIKYKEEENPRRSPMATTVSALNGSYPVMLPGMSPSSGPLVPPSASMLYQSFFRYYCMHCKIKFSSTSTLQAHQNFYCPMRKMNEPEMSNKLSSDSSQKPVRSPVQEERSPPSHVCQYCHIELSTAQHLAAHQKACAESTAKISHLPCLYCSFIAYNETALAEHVKTHVPTKSYMCRLCGYRGNTMRGMRMHAKVHVDSAETFTDDCILVLSDDGVPIQDHNGPGIGNGVSVTHYRDKDIPHRAAESIPSSHWLKERKDSGSPERHMCIICGAVFSSQSMLEQHVVIHKKDREVFQCKLCRFESHEQSQLLEHMKLVHRQTPTHETDSNEEIKVSVDELSNQEQPLSPGEIRRTDFQKNSDSFSVSSETKENLTVSTVRVKQEAKDSDSGDASQSPKSNENLPPNERMFKPLPVGPVAPLSPVMSHNVSVSDSSGQLQSNKCEKVGAKYCKQCDITFTYLSTFIAHKKYYCTANSAEKAAT